MDKISAIVNENKKNVGKKILWALVIIVVVLFLISLLVPNKNKLDDINEIKEISNPKSEKGVEIGKVLSSAKDFEPSLEGASAGISANEFIGIRNLKFGKYYDVTLWIRGDSDNFCEFTKNREKTNNALLKLKDNIYSITDQVDTISFVCDKKVF